MIICSKILSYVNEILSTKSTLQQHPCNTHILEQSLKDICRMAQVDLQVILGSKDLESAEFDPVALINQILPNEQSLAGTLFSFVFSLSLPPLFYFLSATSSVLKSEFDHIALNEILSLTSSLCFLLSLVHPLLVSSAPIIITWNIEK